MSKIEFQKLPGQEFNLKITLLGGQSFSWNKVDQQTFLGVIGQKAIVLRQQGKNVLWQTFPQQNDITFIEEYFQTQTSNPIPVLSQDPIIAEAIQKLGKIRVLKQPKEYTLITFILSANNNIARIKQIVRGMSNTFGETIQIPEVGAIELFPTAKALAQATEESLQKTGLGFRAKYVLEAAKKLAEQPDLLEDIARESTTTQRQRLKEFYGVGDKIAECVRGFGFGMGDASPIDVWIKRILEERYNVTFKSQESYIEWFNSRFGNLSLYANQYLFEGYRR